jgi:hypothetical protein
MPIPNTADVSRRHLLAVLAVFTPAAVGFRRRARIAAQELDHATLDALGASVLPAELGAAGIGPVVRGFERWLAGYRGGAELLHGYGAAEIRRTPPSPAVRWKTQLAALDREARRRSGRSFAQLPGTDRLALVSEALADVKSELPDPASAHHVGLGLVAFWAATPGASDLAYGARVGKLNCRPLAASPERPAPLGGPG